MSCTYTFDTNSPSPTNGHHLLIATPGFDGVLGGITPDFVLDEPDFLFTGGGNLKLNDLANGGFEQAFNFNYAALPTDGLNSLNPINLGLNSPTNYNGAVGFVPEPATAMILVLASTLLFQRRFRRRG